MKGDGGSGGGGGALKWLLALAGIARSVANSVESLTLSGARKEQEMRDKRGNATLWVSKAMDRFKDKYCWDIKSFEGLVV